MTGPVPAPAAAHSAPPVVRPRGWPVPMILVLVSAIPVTVGALRLVQLLGGPALIPVNDRLAGFPLPLVVHILGATTYALLGILQFVPRIRRDHPAWHRRSGRVLIIAGLVVAASALWLTVAFPRQPGSGDLLYLLRLSFATALAATLILGLRAIRRREIDIHRAWMIRAYAIAVAAGTQAFTVGIAEASFGTGDLVGDLARAAGWMINLAVAEYVIRRHGRSARVGESS